MTILDSLPTKYLTAQYIGEKFGIDRKEMYRLAREGKIKYVQRNVGGTFYFEKESFKKFLKERDKELLDIEKGGYKNKCFNYIKDYDKLKAVSARIHKEVFDQLKKDKDECAKTMSQYLGEWLTENYPLKKDVH